jgi:hypothetical protein
METDMNKQTLRVAAALFAVGSIVSAANAQGSVKCTGINACKGQSSCMTSSSSCKGLNNCKGQGWSETASDAQCTAKGGKVLK